MCIRDRPESAQVGTDRLNVPDVLLLHRSGKQSAALGLELQPHAGDVYKRQDIQSGRLPLYSILFMIISQFYIFVGNGF